jgi:hypothetical protein
MAAKRGMPERSRLWTTAPETMRHPPGRFAF